MSRRGRGQNRKGRSKNEGQFAKVTYAMLQSDAWRSLSGAAIKVYLELRTRFHGTNNGRLHLSLQSCADLLALSKSTAQRAYVELEEKGFIVKKRQGCFIGGCASEWALTELKLNDEPATHDWKHWRTARARSSSKKQPRRPRSVPLIAPVGSPPYRGPKR